MWRGRAASVSRSAGERSTFYLPGSSKHGLMAAGVLCAAPHRRAGQLADRIVAGAAAASSARQKEAIISCGRQMFSSLECGGLAPNAEHPHTTRYAVAHPASHSFLANDAGTVHQAEKPQDLRVLLPILPLGDFIDNNRRLPGASCFVVGLRLLDSPQALGTRQALLRSRPWHIRCSRSSLRGNVRVGNGTSQAGFSPVKTFRRLRLPG